MYQYTEFDEIPLPVQDHTQQHDPTSAESTVVDSVGGAFDWLGSTRRRGRRQIITFTGTYSGEVHNLIDDASDPLVDDGGDNLIVGSAAQDVRASVTAIMEKIGQRGTLWRTRLDDDVQQWKTARLLSIPWEREVVDVGLLAELTCQLETTMDAWRAESSSSDSVGTSSGVPAALTVDNGGSLSVTDAIITVTHTSGTITQVDIDDAAAGIDLTWTGSLGSGNVLTIDCGAQTVKKGSADAYSTFSLGSGHTVQGWCPLAVGANPIVVKTTGGAATVAITYYEQFP